VTDPSQFTILVADDQPDVRFALRFLLRAGRFGVETAGSPKSLNGFRQPARPRQPAAEITAALAAGI
jgi:CheY-like chemotaxis protein